MKTLPKPLSPSRVKEVVSGLLRFPGHETATGYRRELDLTTATLRSELGRPARVRYGTNVTELRDPPGAVRTLGPLAR